jgi:hypothetical protein
MAQVPNYLPTDGLVAYYPFTSNANDISGNANNGTVNGATLTTDRFGNANSAYSFNGSSNYIQCDLTTTLNTSSLSGITLSGWTNNSTYSQSAPQVITALFDTSNTSYSIGYGNSNGTNAFLSGSCGYAGIGSAMQVTPTTPPTPNNWYHVVMTCDFSTNISKLYINGIYQSQSSSSLIAANLNKIIIGKWYSSNWFQNGKLDDIGIWNRALTQQEVSNMYNQVTPYSDTCNAVSGSLTQGLVAYWPFCGNANDDSGNGNNGTVNGATLTTDRFGNVNSAYMFEPSSTVQKITTNYTGISGNNNRSISLWFKQNIVDSSTDIKVLCSYGGSGATFTPGVYQNRVGLDISNCYTYYSPNTFGNWHHYVITYDNGNGNGVQSPKIYLDGVLLTSVFQTYNLPGVINTLISNNFEIGGVGNSLLNQFNGKIDDVGIWNRALTTQEITQLYNQNQCFTNTTVTDTLVINVGQLGFNPVTYANNISIYPNPASTQINISFNTIADLNGGTIKIINSLGQQVATTPITATGTNTIMTLSTWGGAGLYFVQIVNPQGQIVDIKKIILQ